MDSYEDRILKLEKQVADLKDIVQKLQQTKPTHLPLQPQPQKPKSTKAIEINSELKTKNLQDSGKNSEKWLGRLGIGLLLFGAVFLFKYSIDQGWITPLVRVLFGIGLGIILLVFGLRIYVSNKMLSRLLLGGGIATYYITIFSAFQLYELLPHLAAILFMIIVTALAFLLALRQDEHILSLIGAVGGFMTPFLLYTGESNIPGLASYTILIILGSISIYMFKGWRILLWTSSLSSWIIWSIAIAALPESPVGYLTEKWSIQAGIIISWFSFALLPVWRNFLHFKSPASWPFPEFIFLENRVTRQAVAIAQRHLNILVLTAPVTALIMTSYIWEWREQSSGFVNLTAALSYLAFFIFHRKNEKLSSLIYTHGLTAIVIGTWAVLLLFDGSTQFIILALESWAILVIAQKIKDNRLIFLANIFIGIMAIVLIFRVFTLGALSPNVFNTRSLVDIIFNILLGQAAISMFKSDSKIILFSLAHFGLMGWFLREFQNFENGQGLVTLFWGLIGLAVLIIAIQKGYLQFRYLGSFTIVVVIGKLFLVDLAQLETIWRIVLFIGFGGLLLFVSNYIQKILKNKTDE